MRPIAWPPRRPSSWRRSETGRASRCPPRARAAYPGTGPASALGASRLHGDPASILVGDARAPLRVQPHGADRALPQTLWRRAGPDLPHAALRGLRDPWKGHERLLLVRRARPLDGRYVHRERAARCKRRVLLHAVGRAPRRPARASRRRPLGHRRVPGARGNGHRGLDRGGAVAVEEGASRPSKRDGSHPGRLSRRRVPARGSAHFSSVTGVSGQVGRVRRDCPRLRRTLRRGCQGHE